MRILLAFIITVLVYSMFIWLYLSNFQDIKIDRKRYTQSVVKINIVNIPPPKEKIVVKKETIKKTKKVVKNKKIKKRIKKRVKKKRKKIKKIATPKKTVKKKIVKKKKVIKKVVKKKVIVAEEIFIPESEIIYIPNPMIKDDIELENLLFDNKVAVKTDMSYPSSKVKNLYGREFLSYTPNQKKFIKQNLDEIHKITQDTLWRRGYPGGMTSARTGQEGTNIVSFYLHPNGDISDLRLKQKVGYRALDTNTIETIKSAYKDYPYPQEKTKMIFFVEYSIFGY